MVFILLCRSIFVTTLIQGPLPSWEFCPLVGGVLPTSGALCREPTWGSLWGPVLDVVGTWAVDRTLKWILDMKRHCSPASQ